MSCCCSFYVVYDLLLLLLLFPVEGGRRVKTRFARGFFAHVEAMTGKEKGKERERRKERAFVARRVGDQVGSMAIFSYLLS